MFYTKTDAKRDSVFIPAFKKNCGSQGYVTRHSDFNESLQLCLPADTQDSFAGTSVIFLSMASHNRIQEISEISRG